LAIRKPHESDMFTPVSSAPSRGVAVATPSVERVVHEPHKAGIPKIKPYADALWRRRHFASELSKSTMRAAHSTTFFGRLWLVINPTLNAAVYYLLVVIIAGNRQGPDYFAHLLAGLFAFNFVAQCMSTGAASVVGGGKLVMNTAFPRLLLPFSAVRTAFFRFLPTMGVFFFFFIFFIIFGPYPTVPGRGEFKGLEVPGNTLHFSFTQLAALPALGLIVIFAAGLAALFGTLQVYFRDMTSFLPYFNRIWLYMSPVLYFVDQMPASWAKFEVLNPLFPLFGVWGDTLVRGEMPDWKMWLAAVAWAVGTFVLGSLFFMSREREFAVRI
jgi:teichoic acid transport system permease protein